MASAMNKMKVIQEYIWKNILSRNTKILALSPDLSGIGCTVLAAHVKEG